MTVFNCRSSVDNDDGDDVENNDDDNDNDNDDRWRGSNYGAVVTSLGQDILYRYEIK